LRILGAVIYVCDKAPLKWRVDLKELGVVTVCGEEMARKIASSETNE